MPLASLKSGHINSFAFVGALLGAAHARAARPVGCTGRGCPESWWGDGRCDLECFPGDGCAWDGGDCLFLEPTAQGCYVSSDYDSVLGPIGGCSCHPSCRTCGSNKGRPTGADQCWSCAEGKQLLRLEDGGAHGRCVAANASTKAAISVGDSDFNASDLHFTLVRNGTCRTSTSGRCRLISERAACRLAAAQFATEPELPLGGAGYSKMHVGSHARWPGGCFVFDFMESKEEYGDDEEHPSVLVLNLNGDSEASCDKWTPCLCACIEDGSPPPAFCKCPADRLGNSECDPACNSTACAFDHGDCISVGDHSMNDGDDTVVLGDYALLDNAQSSCPEGWRAPASAAECEFGAWPDSVAAAKFEDCTSRFVVFQRHSPRELPPPCFLHYGGGNDGFQALRCWHDLGSSSSDWGLGAFNALLCIQADVVVNVSTHRPASPMSSPPSSQAAAAIVPTSIRPTQRASSDATAIVFGAVGFGVGVAYIIGRKVDARNNQVRNERTDYALIAVLLVNLLDVLTDGIVLFGTLLPDPRLHWHFVVSACSLVLCFALNFIACVTFLNTELKNNPNLGDWLSHNVATTACITLFSSVNAGILQLICSNIFELHCFHAPIYVLGRQRMRVFGIISNVVEDLPQIILILSASYVTGEWGFLAVVSIVVSALAVMFGMLKRTFEHFVHRHFSTSLDENSQNQTTLPDRMRRQATRARLLRRLGVSRSRVGALELTNLSDDGAGNEVEEGNGNAVEHTIVEAYAPTPGEAD